MPRQPRKAGSPELAALERSGQARAVSVTFEGIEDVPLHYANVFMVQHSQHEFFVTFAQVQPPAAKSVEELSKVKSVKGRTVFRVAVTPTRMEELIQILTQNYQKYLAQIESEDTDGERGGND